MLAIYNCLAWWSIISCCAALLGRVSAGSPETAKERQKNQGTEWYQFHSNWRQQGISTHQGVSEYQLIPFRGGLSTFAGYVHGGSTLPDWGTIVTISRSEHRYVSIDTYTGVVLGVSNRLDDSTLPSALFTPYALHYPNFEECIVLFNPSSERYVCSSAALFDQSKPEIQITHSTMPTGEIVAVAGQSVIISRGVGSPGFGACQIVGSGQNSVDLLSGLTLAYLGNLISTDAATVIAAGNIDATTVVAAVNLADGSIASSAQLPVSSIAAVWWLPETATAWVLACKPCAFVSLKAELGDFSKSLAPEVHLLGDNQTNCSGFSSPLFVGTYIVTTTATQFAVLDTSRTGGAVQTFDIKDACALASTFFETVLDEATSIVYASAQVPFGNSEMFTCLRAFDVSNMTAIRLLWSQSFSLPPISGSQQPYTPLLIPLGNTGKNGIVIPLDDGALALYASENSTDAPAHRSALWVVYSPTSSVSLDIPVDSQGVAYVTDFERNAIMAIDTTHKPASQSWLTQVALDQSIIASCGKLLREAQPGHAWVLFCVDAGVMAASSTSSTPLQVITAESPPIAIAYGPSYGHPSIANVLFVLQAGFLQAWNITSLFNATLVWTTSNDALSCPVQFSSSTLSMSLSWVDVSAIPRLAVLCPVVPSYITVLDADTGEQTTQYQFCQSSGIGTGLNQFEITCLQSGAESTDDDYPSQEYGLVSVYNFVLNSAVVTNQPVVDPPIAISDGGAAAIVQLTTDGAGHAFAQLMDDKGNILFTGPNIPADTPSGNLPWLYGGLSLAAGVAVFPSARQHLQSEGPCPLSSSSWLAINITTGVVVGCYSTGSVDLSLASHITIDAAGTTYSIVGTDSNLPLPVFSFMVNPFAPIPSATPSPTPSPSAYPISSLTPNPLTRVNVILRQALQGQTCGNTFTVPGAYGSAEDTSHVPLAPGFESTQVYYICEPGTVCFGALPNCNMPNQTAQAQCMAVSDIADATRSEIDCIAVIGGPCSDYWWPPIVMYTSDELPWLRFSPNVITNERGVFMQSTDAFSQPQKFGSRSMELMCNAGTVVDWLEIGAECGVNAQCLSNYCDEAQGICQGTAGLGDPCVTVADGVRDGEFCKIGLRCIARTCVTMPTLGQACTTDDECALTDYLSWTFCSSLTQTCEPLYSVPVGTTILRDCDLPQFGYCATPVCVTGYATMNGQGSLTCSEETGNWASLGESCSTVGEVCSSVQSVCLPNANDATSATCFDMSPWSGPYLHSRQLFYQFVGELAPFCPFVPEIGQNALQSEADMTGSIFGIGFPSCPVRVWGGNAAFKKKMAPVVCGNVFWKLAQLAPGDAARPVIEKYLDMTNLAQYCTDIPSYPTNEPGDDSPSNIIKAVLISGALVALFALLALWGAYRHRKKDEAERPLLVNSNP